MGLFASVKQPLKLPLDFTPAGCSRCGQEILPTLVGERCACASGGGHAGLLLDGNVGFDCNRAICVCVSVWFYEPVHKYANPNTYVGGFSKTAAVRRCSGLRTTRWILIIKHRAPRSSRGGICRLFRFLCSCVWALACHASVLPTRTVLHVPGRLHPAVLISCRPRAGMVRPSVRPFVRSFIHLYRMVRSVLSRHSTLTALGSGGVFFIPFNNIHHRPTRDHSRSVC